jgi:MFS family permease
VLKRVPDVSPPPDDTGGKGPVPWLAMAAHPPFKKLLYLNAAWSLAYGGLTTFVVKYLKDGAGLPSDLILYFMSVSFIGGLAAPWLAGPRMDRLGSKPVLGLTMAIGFVIGTGWMFAAAGAVKPGWGYALPLMVLLGLVNAIFSAANNRLAMHIVPPMGRNHFFALFMVVWQITLGLSPVAWGLLLDVIGTREAHWLGLEWNRYSVYFGLSAAAFVVAGLLCRKLEEPKAAEMQALMRELFVVEPRRWWSIVTGR